MDNQVNRPDNTIVALNLALMMVKANAGTLRADQICVKNNAIHYNDGVNSYTITVTTRNFMDDRREAMARAEIERATAP